MRLATAWGAADILAAEEKAQPLRLHVPRPEPLTTNHIPAAVFRRTGRDAKTPPQEREISCGPTPCSTTSVQGCGSRSHQRQPTTPDLSETAIPAIRKTFAATAVAAAILAGTAACSTAEDLTAAQRLDKALDKLGQEHSLSLELGLDTKASTLQALDADAALGQQMPDQVAELLAGTRVSVSVQSKKPLKESSGQDITSTMMKVAGPDGDLLEYRLVGDWAYLRAGVQSLEKATGGQLPSADEHTALKQVLDGGWVKIPADGHAQDALGEQFTQFTQFTAPSVPPVLAAPQKPVVERLRELMTREVQVKDAGTKDGTDHIAATAPLGTLLTGLADELRPLSGDLPPGARLPTGQDFKDAPSQKVTADFSLNNGDLTKASVDLAELAKAPQGHKFALVLRIGEGEQATAPATATQVDPAALTQELLSGLGPALTSGEAP